MPDKTVYSGTDVVGRTEEVKQQVEVQSVISKTFGGVISDSVIAIKKWLGIITRPTRSTSPLGALESVKNLKFNKTMNAMSLRDGMTTYAGTYVDLSGATTLTAINDFFPLSTETPSADTIDIICGTDASSNKHIFQRHFWEGTGLADNDNNAKYIKWGETNSSTIYGVTSTTVLFYGTIIVVTDYYKGWIIVNSSRTNDKLYVTASDMSSTRDRVTVTGNVPSSWEAGDTIVLYRNFHDNYTFSPTYSTVSGRPPVALQQGNAILFSGGMGSTVGLKPIWSGYLNKTFFVGATNKTGGVNYTGTYVSEAEIKNTNGLTVGSLNITAEVTNPLTIGRWFFCIVPETDDGERGNPIYPTIHYIDIGANQRFSYSILIDFAQLNKRLRYLNIFAGLAPNSTDTTIEWSRLSYVDRRDLLSSDFSWVETSTLIPGYFIYGGVPTASTLPAIGNRNCDTVGDWTATGAGITFSSAVGFYGETSFVITTIASDSSTNFISLPVVNNTTYIAGSTYKISMWVEPITFGTSFRIKAGGVESATITTPSAWGYVQYSFIFNALNTASTFLIYSPSGGGFRIDNITVEEITGNLSWIDNSIWNNKTQESLDAHLGHPLCTSTTASFSEAAFCNNRLFIARYYDYVDAVEYLDQLRYTDFAGNGKAQLNVLCNLDGFTQSTIEQGDPTSVQTLRRYQDKLLILKDASCYYIPVTDDPINWLLVTVSNTVGCTVPRTAVVTPTMVIWCQDGEDVYGWSGSDVFSLGQNLLTTFKALTLATATSKGWYDIANKTYNFTYLLGTWYTMFLECPIPNGYIWAKNDFSRALLNIVDVAERAGRTYIVVLDTLLTDIYSIFYFNPSATTDNTLAIAPYFKTAESRLDEKGILKLLKWYLTLTPTGGAGTLDCKVTVGSNVTTYSNITKTNTLHARGIPFTACQGRSFQFEFNANATPATFTGLEIYELHFDYEMLPFIGDNTITT